MGKGKVVLNGCGLAWKGFWGYVTKNLYFVAILIGMILWGWLRGGLKPWENWEHASIIGTMLYAAGLYMKLFLDNQLSGKKLALAVLAVGMLLIASGLSGIPDLSIGGKAIYTNSRTTTMFLLFVAASLFCALDGVFATHDGRYSVSYKNSLKFSDAPITLAFLTLWLYSMYVQSDQKLAESLDPFFSGAIAFQMILSNFVWSITDDDIIDPAGAKASTT